VEPSAGGGAETVASVTGIGTPAGGRGPLDELAHELRSPVAALAGIAEAYDAADDERRGRLVELAGRAVSSIERLLEDGATTSLRTAPTDVRSVARDAVEAAALRGAVVLEPGDERLVVEADAARLRQALDNLIGNALGHAPAGTRVTVAAYGESGSVVVAVADAGEGIAADDFERVFDAGVRLTDSRPGHGLGLAVVREIARAHGGEVEVDSAPGQGATFRLVLPGASASG
jgi:two-component system OmpR family sensor kinase